MNHVLVLNATYEPLNVVSVRRAVLLLLKEKAELVEAAEAWLRSERMALQVPLVIRLVYYVRIPRRFALPLSRRTVLARDHYTCQYCGRQGRTEDRQDRPRPKPASEELTLDHVIPRAQGGESRWDNCVLACLECNKRKADRTPEQAKMRLKHKPVQPKWNPLYAAHDLRIECWSKFLSEAYWNVKLET